MKEWFMAKSLAVKALIAVLAVAVVAGAGAGIYLGTRKAPAKEPTQVLDISDEGIPATDVPEVKEEEEITEPATSEPEEIVAEEVTEVVEEEIEEYYRAKEGTAFVNGNFSEGLYGYEVFAMNADEVEYGTSENGFYINIGNTGSEDWHVQLKQNDVRLVKGRWYRVSLDAKSSINRAATVVMMRDGSNDDDWRAYSPSVKMNLTPSWKNFSTVFQMSDATDNAVFNVSMGAIDGVKITNPHEIDIRNIKVELLPDNFVDTLKVNGNLVANGDFSNGNLLWEGSVVAPGQAAVSFDNNKATFNITNPGAVDWHVQLKQGGLNLQNNTGYRLSFTVSTTVARTIKVGVMDTNYVNWYGGADLVLNAGTNEINVGLYNSICDDPNAILMISMGKIDGVSTPASTIEISNINMIKTEEVTLASVRGGASGGAGGGANPTTFLGNNWEVYDHENAHTNGSSVDGANGFKINVKNIGTEAWHVQLTNKTMKLEKGKSYKLNFDVKSSIERNIQYMIQKNGGDWATYSDAPVIGIDSEWKHVTQTFVMNNATDNAAIFNFSLGKVDDTASLATHSIWIKNISFEEVVYNGPEKTEDGYLIKSTHDKTEDEYGAKWIVNLDPADYGIENAAGKNLTISMDITAEGSFDGLLGACRTSSWAWVDNSPNNETDAAHWTLDVDDFMGALQVQINSMAADSLEITNITIVEREEVPGEGEETPGEGEETPDAEVVAVINASTPKNEGGNPEIEIPVDQALIGKKVRVDIELESDAYFNGMIGGCNTSAWDWTQTDTLEAADGKATWSYEFYEMQGALKLQIFWMSAEEIKVKSVTFTEVTDIPVEPSEPETPEVPEETVVAVFDASTPKNEGNNPEIEFPVDQTLIGKKVRVDIVLESDGEFNGMVGGCNTSAWAWTQTDTLESANGKAVWSYEFYEMQGALKAQIFWMDADEVRVKSVTFTEVVEEPVTPSEPEEPVTPSEPEVPVEPETPAEEQPAKIVLTEANNSYEIDPTKYGVEEPFEKDLKITVKLISEGGFSGTVAGNDESGWNMLPEQRGTANEEAVWTQTLNGFKCEGLKVEIWWNEKNAVEITDIKVEEVIVETEKSEESEEESTEE